MDIHLVGGFLGSGKTTAILAAADEIVRVGKKVGIITNEQGKHLVDTHFLRASGHPVLDVAGGCFCCHLDDFVERMDQIYARHQPDVLFAESVGSCTDLVATIIKPLLEIQEASAHPASFSVFTDSRLLLRWLKGQEMPFNDDIVYIFEQQIEEANLLIVNKIDLLPEKEAMDILALVREKFFEKQVKTQNSLERADTLRWLEMIMSQAARLPERSLDLDYDRYAQGEGRFFWIDREYAVRSDGGFPPGFFRGLVGRVVAKIKDQGVSIAHVKWLIQDGSGKKKFSLTAMDDTQVLTGQNKKWLDQVKDGSANFLLNIMAEGELDVSGAVVDEEIAAYGAASGITFSERSRFDRVPSYPRPTKRIR